MTAASDELAYIGDELELFSAAQNWKSYWASKVRPYLGVRVLDVGAGIGATVQLLDTDPHQHWTALEPDPRLAERMREQGMPANCEIKIGTLASIEAKPTFDTILYIDVLEHIEDDKAEMARAAERLHSGGRIIVLAPAYQYLFTPFDRAIGHFRRYDKNSLAAVTPAGLSIERLFHLDSIGMLASLGNKLVLRSSSPKPSQIALWDNLMVPCSRLADPLTGFMLGKTVIGVWRKD